MKSNFNRSVEFMKKTLKYIVAVSIVLFCLLPILVMFNITGIPMMQMITAIIMIFLMVGLIAIWFIMKELKQVGELTNAALFDMENFENEKKTLLGYLEIVDDSIFDLDVDTGKIFCFRKWQEITTYPVIDKITWEWIDSHLYAEDITHIKRIIDNRHGSFYEQIRIRTSDRQERWLGINGTWLQEPSGKPHRISGRLSNITQQKKSEAYLEFIAYHDELTLMPNRAFYMDILGRAIDEAIKQGTQGAMFFIDIDNFKVVNDLHGHSFGDRLLLEVGDRLRLVCQVLDTIARFGGDEFMILMENVSDISEVEKKAEAIMKSLSEPISLDTQSFYTTTSIGIAMFPKDGDNVVEIIKNADSAMYKSKENGRNTYSFYDKIISEQIVRKNQISDKLRTAIEDNIIYMEFQPQYEIESQRVRGFEALMRMEDDQLGCISPAEFISIAEETGAIVPIGYWAIRQVIACDKRLREEGLDFNWMAVNVSEIQLREHDFLENIEKILTETQFPPSRLHIEITEGILLAEIEKKSKLFGKMKDLGIKIELDDFGTGYSSLNYIRAIPLNTIKIDKCFIDEIGKSAEKEALIGLIINLAKEYQMKTICEGVETEEQVEFLKKKGASYLQGYFYSKSLPKDLIIQKVNKINNIKFNTK